MIKIATADLHLLVGKLVKMVTGIRNCSAPLDSIGNVKKFKRDGRKIDVLLDLRYEGFNGSMGPHEHKISLRSFKKHFLLLDTAKIL